MRKIHISSNEERTQKLQKKSTYRALYFLLTRARASREITHERQTHLFCLLLLLLLVVFNLLSRGAEENKTTFHRRESFVIIIIQRGFSCKLELCVFDTIFRLVRVRFVPVRLLDAQERMHGESVLVWRELRELDAAERRRGFVRETGCEI